MKRRKMKNVFCMATFAMLAATVTVSYATNGDNIIGTGAVSRAMGGTGIASGSGSENTLKNPALLGKSRSDDIYLGVTWFRPDVKVETTAGSRSDPMLGTEAKSATTDALMPTLTFLHRLDEAWVCGAGMYATAGMGVDFKKASPSSIPGAVGLYGMYSSLGLMKGVVTLAYHKQRWGLGAGLVAQYGKLELDFTSQTPNGLRRLDAGSSDDLGFGVELGGFFNPCDSITVGLKYSSKIAMRYGGQISKAAGYFGFGMPGSNVGPMADDLDQPAVYGIGIAYAEEGLTLAFDYRLVAWAETAGYEDFGWKNQNVYAFGARYARSGWWIAAGYNYAKMPLRENEDMRRVHPSYPNTVGDTLNTFNFILFPATTESHITMGAGWHVTPHLMAESAIVYAQRKQTRVRAESVGLGEVTTEHSQSSLTLSMRYIF